MKQPTNIASENTFVASDGSEGGSVGASEGSEALGEVLGSEGSDESEETLPAGVKVSMRWPQLAHFGCCLDISKLSLASSFPLLPLSFIGPGSLVLSFVYCGRRIFFQIQ